MRRLVAILALIMAAVTGGHVAWAQPAGQGGAAALPVHAQGRARLQALLSHRLQVRVPPGVYLIDGEIEPRDGQVIEAAAPGQVVLLAAPAYDGRLLSAVGRRVTLRNLVLDGDHARRRRLEGLDGASLVRLVQAPGSVLEGNRFQNAPAQALQVERSPRLLVRGNDFIETFHAIRLDGGDLDDSGTIEGNRFLNTAALPSLQHLTAVYTRDLVVRGNTWEGAGLAEPRRHGYEGTWGNSLYIFNSTRYRVEANRVGRNRWSSLVSGMNGTQAVIRGNTFSDSPHTPIAAWIEQAGAEHITFEDNLLDGGLFMGDNGGDHLTIVGNTIRSRDVGMDVSFATRHALIRGNTIRSKAARRSGNGIYLWDKQDPSTDVRVLDNRIEGFDKGIAINNPGGVGPAYGLTLQGNAFSGNGTDIWVPRGVRLQRPYASGEKSVNRP